MQAGEENPPDDHGDEHTAQEHATGADDTLQCQWERDTGERAYLVVADDQLVGLITLTDVMKYRQQEWDTLPVAAAMTPTWKLRTIGPDRPIEEALRLLAAEDLNQLPVIAGGRAAGLLSRAAIVRFLQLRLQLGVGGSTAPVAAARVTEEATMVPH